MSQHRLRTRRAGGTPSKGALWSVWCTCGWVCPDLTKHPIAKGSEHAADVNTDDMAAMMAAPRGRRYA